MAQITPLSAQLQKVACAELNEVTSRIPEDLKTLKLWIQQQSHLNSRTDDRFLIQFLRGCKYSLEKTKEKIDRFYAYRTKYPEYFRATNLDDVKFRESHNLGVVVQLPTPLNDDGARIQMYRFNYSVDKHNLAEIMLPIMAMQEVMMIHDPYACINGIVFIVDLSKATALHLLQFTPGLVKRILAYYEKTLPLRIKRICYINVPTAAEQFIKLILSLVSEKLRNRIAICGKNIENLYEYVPQKYLPQEYGGSNGSLDNLCAEYNKVWDENREYFKQNSEYGTDERLRPGRPMDFDEAFGTEGSFRRINVD